MTQTVYGLVSDGGDGSASIRWFRNKELVDSLLDDNEIYFINEGGLADTFTFPIALDLEECGFLFSDEDCD